MADEKPIAEEATRERLVRATVRLLKEQGPSGTGTAQILDRSRAQRGSLYFFFPGGKDQLVQEAVRRAGAETSALIAQFFELDAPVPDRVGGYFELIAKGQLDDDFGFGCAVGSTTLDLAAVDPSTRAVAAEVFASWTSAVSDHLRDNGIEESRASSLAQAFVATIEGAILLARAMRDVEPILAAGRAMRAATQDAMR